MLCRRTEVGKGKTLPHLRNLLLLLVVRHGEAGLRFPLRGAGDWKPRRRNTAEGTVERIRWPEGRSLRREDPTGGEKF
jgi:hypothetical protein